MIYIINTRDINLFVTIIQGQNNFLTLLIVFAGCHVTLGQYFNALYTRGEVHILTHTYILSVSTYHR